MMLLAYFLGILTGLVVSALILAFIRRYEPSIIRTMASVSSKLAPKGSLLEPQSETLDEFINSLPTDYATPTK